MRSLSAWPHLEKSYQATAMGIFLRQTMGSKLQRFRRKRGSKNGQMPYPHRSMRPRGWAREKRNTNQPTTKHHDVNISDVFYPQANHGKTNYIIRITQQASRKIKSLFEASASNLAGILLLHIDAFCMANCAAPTVTKSSFSLVSTLFHIISYQHSPLILPCSGINLPSRHHALERKHTYSQRVQKIAAGTFPNHPVCLGLMVIGAYYSTQIAANTIVTGK